MRGTRGVIHVYATAVVSLCGAFAFAAPMDAVAHPIQLTAALDAGYGPDNDLPNMDMAHAFPIIVPPNAYVVCSFSSEALHENAAIIYDGRYMRKIREAGNYARSLGTWTSERNIYPTPITLYITGWHKNSPPDGRRDWHQSAGRVLRADFTGVQVGFEDGGDSDYNDMVVTAEVQY